MAKTNNQRLADALVARRLLLFRHEATIRAEINKLLGKLDEAIRAKIVSVAPGDVERQTFKTIRVMELIDQVEKVIAGAYKDVWGYHREQLAGMAEAEAVYLVQHVNVLVGRDLMALKSGAWTSMVRETLMTGAPLADWWAGQADTLKERFAQQMRLGLLQNDSDEDLIKRVRGTREMGFKDGLMETSRRMAKILVRGASSSVSAQARKVAMLDNPRVFKGVQQISVLDGRTSQTCIAYAGKVWELPNYKPVGHSLAYNGGVPRHPNCRSTEIAVLTEQYGGAPAEDMGFEEFLEDKSPSQVANLLGKGKAELYRAGKITLNDLVDQNGRGIPLSGLL